VSTPARQSEVHDLVIDVRLEQGRHRLVLAGELDLASSGNLVEVVSRICGEGAQVIVLDIAQLDFIDSTGLRAILSSRARCAQAECALAVEPEADRIRPQVRRLFQVTGLLERLPFSGPESS
jgi:anti-anti-sigma factor